MERDETSSVAREDGFLENLHPRLSPERHPRVTSERKSLAGGRRATTRSPLLAVSVCARSNDGLMLWSETERQVFFFHIYFFSMITTSITVNILPLNGSEIVIYSLKLIEELFLLLFFPEEKFSYRRFACVGDVKGRNWSQFLWYFLLNGNKQINSKLRICQVSCVIVRWTSTGGSLLVFPIKTTFGN